MLLLTLAIVASVSAGVWSERRFGARAHALSRRLLDLLLYFVLPFVTFFVIASTHLSTGAQVGIALGYVELAIVGLLAWTIARRVLHAGPDVTATIVVATIMANTGYLGTPLNAALLGSDAIAPAITFDTLVSGPMFYVVAFAVAAALTTRGAPTRARLRTYFVRNPPLLAVVAGLLAPDALAPRALVDIAKLGVVGLAPVGFFVLGVLLATDTGGRLPRFSAPIAVATGLRLVVAPALMLGLSALTVAVPHAYLVQAAMPAGINTLVVAHAYDLDLGLTSGTVAWSTAIVVLAGLATLAL